jgi:hypothetical protein
LQLFAKGWIDTDNLFAQPLIISASHRFCEDLPDSTLSLVFTTNARKIPSYQMNMPLPKAIELPSFSFLENEGGGWYSTP